MKKLRVSEHNEFGVVRYTLHNGEQLFAGTDIVKSLGLTNNTMLIDCIEPDDKCELEVNENDIERKVTMINLCGVQSLISSCRMNTKTDTRAFKKWLIKDIGYRSMKEMELSGSDKFILDAIHKAYSKPEVKPEPVVEMVAEAEPEEKLYSISDINAEYCLGKGELIDCLTNTLKWVSPSRNIKTSTLNKGYAVLTGSSHRQFKFTEEGYKIILEILGDLNKKNNNRYPADISGLRFGKLTIINKIKDDELIGSGFGKWNAICDCGKTSTPTRANLISGNTKSCGCGKHDRRKSI